MIISYLRRYSAGVVELFLVTLPVPLPKNIISYRGEYLFVTLGMGDSSVNKPYFFFLFLVCFIRVVLA